MTATSLFLCPEEPTRLVYSGRIRDGRFGFLTPTEFEVWECLNLRLAFLHPFPQVVYSSESYRTAVDGSCAIEEYFRLHDYQQPGYLALFQSVLKRQATVADCGCGGGSLLDVVKGFAGRTIAIEPYQGYHASLRERGHQVYASLEAALEGEASQVDLALSVHVIEHTVDPLQYLRAIRALLKPAGHAVVVTPNLDDILLKLDFARVAPWYFRKEHNYYFTTEGIEWAARRSGFAVVRRIFYHEFGMGNALLWLKDRRPSGHTPVPGINAEADAFWRGYLETTGQANNVGAVLQNAGS